MFRNILVLSFLIGAISGGEVMSEGFGKWLSLNGYDDQGFDDNVEGNFGGLEYPEQLHHLPIVFVSGLQPSTFSKAVSFFLKRNYSMNELYGIISSPDHSIASIFNSTITCSLIRRQRKFLEAVIQYTQTNKVNVISFDLGVTIARKAIKGGVMTDEDGNICNIGVSLSNYINTFISISGMNYGYPYCSKHSNSNIPFCNKVNGMWPGDECTNHNCLSGHKCCDTSYSQLLMDLNEESSGKEGTNIFVIRSSDDDFIGDESTLASGQETSSMPYYDVEYVFSRWSHSQTKDKSLPLQFDLIKKH